MWSLIECCKYHNHIGIHDDESYALRSEAHDFNRFVGNNKSVLPSGECKNTLSMPVWTPAESNDVHLKQ